MSSLATDTRKPLATIYCAENSISGKKYIGFTTRTLAIRKKDHFKNTVKYSHHFANALKFYPPESWQWYILAKVEHEKVYEYERFFIADLDTCNTAKGYNTAKGGGIDGENNLTYNPEIVNLYNPKYGVVTGTRLELRIKYPELDRVCDLVSKKRNRVGDWVLAENKCSNVLNINNRGNSVTLTHKEHGTHTLLQCEFVTKFNLAAAGVSTLVIGKQKSHKGWSLIIGKNESKTKN